MLDRFFPLYISVIFLSVVITALIEKKLIPILTARAKQPIYEAGPKWHTSKSGTPTMGGLAFLISSLLITLVLLPIVYFFVSKEACYAIVLSMAFALSNALIGFIDDLTKLRHKENAGLTPIQKLSFQLIMAVLFLLGRHFILGDKTELLFSFGELDLGIWYYPISVIILLGITNCANLTDGIDGLAASVAFAIGISIFYISAAVNTEACILASIVIGVSIGFLFFNIHPAKIFMGDTGSLFLGALIVSIGHIFINPTVMIFLAVIYVIEGISVILQVASYKLTRKRIFKMAPLHHHLEQLGFGENKICMCAMFVTFVFSVFAYILYLP